MNEIESKTFSIRTDLIGKVESRIERLNRRAARLGVDPVRISVSAPELKQVKAGTERDEAGRRVDKGRLQTELTRVKVAA